jgi:hypothetical protein
VGKVRIFICGRMEAGTEGPLALVNGELDGTGRLVCMPFKSCCQALSTNDSTSFHLYLGYRAEIMDDVTLI